MKTLQPIHFLITGGTIDTYYDPAKETVFLNKKSVIPVYLASLKLFNSKTKVTTVCMKDSRTLTEEDRKILLDEIESSNSLQIIVTHGTYTMPDTARYIKANLKRNDQTIILFGSMIPLKGFAESDAPFNLGYALAKVQDLKPGVYVCMNGYVFVPEEVTKNVEEGKFEIIKK